MARTPIHPGEILGDELRELGISAAELARQLHVPANRISQILRGQRDITADTALRLGRWFGTGPQIWLNLQKTYELDLAQQHSGEILRVITPRKTPHAPMVVEQLRRLAATRRRPQHSTRKPLRYEARG